ncbi:MAG TPA: hypothetical protein VFZ00_35525 [Solirubrobacter sp.]|jgi:hypothetical protein|nr:hypothetical protein [Solirubrobacter sp.]
MSRGTRIGLLVVAVAILVVAFIALRPSADDEGSTADTPTATPTVETTPTGTPEAGETETPTPSPTPRPTVDPGPVLTGDEVEEIRVEKGETVRFRVRPPADDHVHIHGYDIMKDVKAGETTRVFFKADIDGIFEIELEDAGTPIAELRVDP